MLEFLGVMSRRPLLPSLARPLQGLLVRAAVQNTPAWTRQLLGLGDEWTLRNWESALIRAAAGLADRTAFPAHPAVQACRRLGLPGDYLYRRHRGA